MASGVLAIIFFLARVLPRGPYASPFTSQGASLLALAYVLMMASIFVGAHAVGGRATSRVARRYIYTLVSMLTLAALIYLDAQNAASQVNPYTSNPYVNPYYAQAQAQAEQAAMLAAGEVMAIDMAIMAFFVALGAASISAGGWLRGLGRRLQVSSLRWSGIVLTLYGVVIIIFMPLYVLLLLVELAGGQCPLSCTTAVKTLFWLDVVLPPLYGLLQVLSGVRASAQVQPAQAQQAGVK